MSTTSVSKKKKSGISKDTFILGDMKISKDNLLDIIPFFNECKKKDLLPIIEFNNPKKRCL